MYRLYRAQTINTYVQTLGDGLHRLNTSIPAILRSKNDCLKNFSLFWNAIITTKGIASLGIHHLISTELILQTVFARIA